MLYIDKDRQLRAREYREGTWRNVGVLTRWTAGQTPAYAIDGGSEDGTQLTVAVAAPTGAACPSRVQSVRLAPADGDWGATAATGVLSRPGECVTRAPTLSAARGIVAAAYANTDGAVYATVHAPA